LQVPHYSDLEDFVFDTFHQMHEAFERDRRLIPRGQLFQVRYEHLVADPISQMRRLYKELGLGDIEPILPALQQYVASQADYQPNQYEINQETCRTIAQRWQAYCSKYGYSPTNGQDS
jgi:hypothetical protein